MKTKQQIIDDYEASLIQIKQEEDNLFYNSEEMIPFKLEYCNEKYAAYQKIEDKSDYDRVFLFSNQSFTMDNVLIFPSFKDWYNSLG